MLTCPPAVPSLRITPTCRNSPARSPVCIPVPAERAGHPGLGGGGWRGMSAVPKGRSVCGCSRRALSRKFANRTRASNRVCLSAGQAKPVTGGDVIQSCRWQLAEEQPLGGWLPRLRGWEWARGARDGLPTRRLASVKSPPGPGTAEMFKDMGKIPASCRLKGALLGCCVCPAGLRELGGRRFRCGRQGVAG